MYLSGSVARTAVPYSSELVLEGVKERRQLPQGRDTNAYKEKIRGLHKGARCQINFLRCCYITVNPETGCQKTELLFMGFS
jgi:hypothetical protein